MSSIQGVLYLRNEKEELRWFEDADPKTEDGKYVGQINNGEPEGVETLVAVRRHDGHRGPVGQGSVEVPAIPIDVGDDGRLRQTRTDVGSQIDARRPLGKGARRTVGEGDGQIGHGYPEASDPAPPPVRRLTPRRLVRT